MAGTTTTASWIEDLAAAHRAWKAARTARLNRKYQRQEWDRTSHLAPRPIRGGQEGSIFPHFVVQALPPRRPISGASVTRPRPSMTLAMHEQIRDAFRAASDETGAFKSGRFAEVVGTMSLNVRPTDVRAIGLALRQGASSLPRLVAKPRYRIAALSRPHQAA